MFAIDGNRVYLRLSRRNLRQLAALLEDQHAAGSCLVRKDERGASLVLQVEEDADHYHDRAPGVQSAIT